jgi:hypothetical protein
VAGFERADVAKGLGVLAPRAVIAAVNAELEQNRGHQTERRRQELLAQRDQAYQQDFEESERAVEATSRAEQAAPRDPGVAVTGWPAPVEGHTWFPGLNPMVARLVGRGLPVDKLKYFAGAQGPDDPPDDVPRETAAAARFALGAYFPDRAERDLVNDWLDKTGNANNRALIEWAAELGRPLLEELRQAHAERRALAGMNQGAPGYADTAASIAAHYRRIYEGS